MFSQVLLIQHPNSIPVLAASFHLHRRPHRPAAITSSLEQCIHLLPTSTCALTTCFRAAIRATLSEGNSGHVTLLMKILQWLLVTF